MKFEKIPLKPGQKEEERSWGFTYRENNIRDMCELLDALRRKKKRYATGAYGKTVVNRLMKDVRRHIRMLIRKEREKNGKTNIHNR